MKLNEQGFITDYLVSGPKLTPFVGKYATENQLMYEGYLRSIVAVHNAQCPEKEACLGSISELGVPWEYNYSYGNWFVDKSRFDSLLTKVEITAAVHLLVEEEMKVRICIWSYGAIDLWVNKKIAAVIEKPVYKPIIRKEAVITLQKGENALYIKMQNLGVRDTRNIFGIQLLEQKEKIQVFLPNQKKMKEILSIREWLDTIKLSDHELFFSGPAPHGTLLGYDSKSPDITLNSHRVAYEDISGKTGVRLMKNQPYIRVLVSVDQTVLTRKFEVIEDILPTYVKTHSIDENLKLIYQNIGEVVNTDRGDDIGFFICNILARRALNQQGEDDLSYLYETLDQIESRIDCSDFLVNGLIRYVKSYPVDEKLSKRIREVLLNYRYWMDEIGYDCMCFWSENHSLMFYTAAMIAGDMYPDCFFVRAEEKGDRLKRRARAKIESWMEDVESNGFEEFLSGGYMSITFVALLNIVDYGDREIAKRAVNIIDSIFEKLAMHTFKGSVIAPQGRVYRDVIYPFTQGVQTLISMIHPNMYTYGEGWLAFYATSSYALPVKYSELMDKDILLEYSMGNALIRLNKNQHYIMTSVQSPREDIGFKRWENISFEESVDVNQQDYVKSLNERFHGTTCFNPGVYGYQQHMWSVALDCDTLVFVNHPGGTHDDSSMRPGYWFGNGLMPAVKQVGNMIGSIYIISKDYPIPFTHIHWACCRFDEMNQSKHWLVGRKDTGYIGLWHSEVAVPYNDQVSNVEYRVYSRKVAYLCICGSIEEHGSLDAFLDYCQQLQPTFDKRERRLKVQEKSFLEYHQTIDKTQYI